MVSLYSEPLATNNQNRVFINIGGMLSLYRYSMPRVEQRVDSDLVAPQVLNRSM